MRSLARCLGLTALTLALAGCVTEPGPLAGTVARDGRSADRAVPVSGVDEEYAWLAANRPGWHLDRQDLQIGLFGRPYTVFTISRGGEVQKVYFDISGFYGKPA